MSLTGRTVAAAVAISLLTAGCSMGARQGQAERIMGSVGLLRRADQAHGVVEARFHIVKLPEVLRANALGGQVTATINRSVIRFDAGFQFSDRRVRLGVAGTPETAALVVFDDTAAYVRRAGRERSQTSTRDWARLDYADLDRVSRPSAEAAFATIGPSTLGLLNPAYTVELLSGTLTGSVRRRGPATVAGVATTRYDANFSFDKAYSKLHLNEHDADARRRVKTLLAISSDVVPGSVWLDGRGRPVRMQVTFTQRATRRMELKLFLAVNLSDFGKPQALKVPAKTQTLQVTTTTELLRGLTT